MTLRACDLLNDRATLGGGQILRGAKPADLPIEATCEVRTRDQSENREGAGLDDPAVVSTAGRLGDRMINRRKLLCLLTLGTLAGPRTAQAQQAGKVRIGYLAPGTAATNAGLRKAFTDGLLEHGWLEEKNVAIEYR